ncbi:tetratricopeptide repeat protein [Acanthopleuribacter pedis]|uniref:Tetratricopeptide repeat protein n=1 Tax=Acanthopleuribacter pedis TaxID=442870 RepID=A0A8J7Q9T7_9BACT|nr:hypothetical protein [Acanthopleuribacter pedis]MBO1319624.1 hypothetical protein [Acanthopleuribacter pedis]
MVPVWILLFPTLLFGQGADPNFETISKTKKPSGVKGGIYNMAKGLHVLYGTHDLANIDQLYEAVNLVHKGARKMEVASPFPKLPSNYKKDRERIKKDPFLRGVIFSNQALAEALNTQDTAQQLANLRRLFREQPDHLPTLVAITEALWATGETEAGNDFAAAIAAVVPPEAFVPSALVTAELTRKSRSFKEGRELLEKAAKLPFGQAKQVHQRLERWERERTAASTDLAALYDMHAEETLTGLAKTDPEALFYLAKIKSDQRLPLASFKLLDKAIRKKPDLYEALAYYYSVKGAELSDPYPTRIHAKRGMKKVGEHPVFLTMIARRNPQLSVEKQRQMLARAIELDATYLPAWRAWFLVHRDAAPAWRREQEQKLMAANVDSPEALQLLLEVRLKVKDFDQVDQLVVAAMALAHQTPSLLSKCLDTLPFVSDQDLKNRLTLAAVHQAVTFAGKFQHFKAAEFVAKAARHQKERPRLSLLAANYYYRGGFRGDSVAHYEAALAALGESAALYELIGDGYFDQDKMTKSIKAYNQALSLDETRPLPPMKIKEADKRINQKVRQGIADALTFLSFAGGAMHGHFAVPMRHKRYNSPAVAKADSLDEYRESRGAYGVSETEPMLMPLYNQILDWEAAYNVEPVEQNRF